MKLTDQELEMLKSAQSPVEWNSLCNQIKRARNGQYPEDWYSKVIVSGLIRSKELSWK